MKALVLAGGQGMRLWPLSRKAKPKQFQRLLGKKTMFQQTVDRLLSAFPQRDIFVSTNKEYAEEVKKEAPCLPQENIITEPERRERVAALSLFLSRLKEKEFEEPLVFLPSDHLIKDEKKFLRALSVGERFIRENSEYILTLGARPTFPDTGLGYIKKGKPLKRIDRFYFYQVDFFKEKPNLKRAQRYFRSGRYLWNMGIFLFIPKLAEELIKRFVPDTYKRYKTIKAARGKSGFKRILKREYGRMDPVGFDYSIIENYSRLAVLPLDVGWSDVGSWSVLKDCLTRPGGSFVKGNYLGVESKNVMVYGSASKQLIATLGVRDLIVAVTDDIILICHKDGSQKVKELVKKLEKSKKFNYL